MKISIFGLGYVGTTSAACFSAMGHEIIGVDIVEEKIEKINKGISPVYEKGLDRLLSKAKRDNLIFASKDYKNAVKATELSLICVGTPSLPNGQTDLSFVSKISEQIAYSLREKSQYHSIVIRSTIPPGTIEDKLIPLIEDKSQKIHGKEFGVSMNPEFLREGSAFEDFFSPERIIIGCSDQKSFEKNSEIYESSTFQKVEAPIFRVDTRLAEMCKYVDNSYHALKVAFANEIGSIAKKLDINSQMLMEIFCEDRKLNLSKYYFRPGFSFGGSCLPKDLRGLNAIGKSLELELPLLNSVMESNSEHTYRAIDIISKQNLKRIGFLGLTFKADTDDFRENPIINVIEALKERFDIFLYDETIILSDTIFSDKGTIVDDFDDLIKQIDVIVLSNNSKKYAKLAKASNKTIIDLSSSVDNTDNVYRIV